MDPKSSYAEHQKTLMSNSAECVKTDRIQNRGPKPFPSPRFSMKMASSIPLVVTQKAFQVGTGSLHSLPPSENTGSSKEMGDSFICKDYSSEFCISLASDEDFKVVPMALLPPQ